MENSEIIGDFEVSGVSWKCINNDHQNAMWYRHLTTEEINSFGFDLDVGDSEPLGEDELGFFIWNDAFDRPVVVIECVKKSTKYELITSRTNFGPNRAGAAEPMGQKYQKTARSIKEVNSQIKEIASKLSSLSD